VVGEVPYDLADLLEEPDPYRGISLSDYQLSIDDSRIGFLWHLYDEGYPLLFEATSHVWKSLSEPRAARCELMGAVAGVGGHGKVALRRVLKEFIREALEAEPDFPARDEFASFEDWHDAAMSSFDVGPTVRPIVQKYSAVLNGQGGEQSPGSNVLYGPWLTAPAVLSSPTQT
jgi:hypothetical protein